MKYLNIKKLPLKNEYPVFKGQKYPFMTIFRVIKYHEIWKAGKLRQTQKVRKK